jgi:hypothetical protein
MGLRTKEDGESECRFVMRRIEIESSDNIISRESEQTSIWYLITRKFGNPSQEGMQDDSRGKSNDTS